MRPSSSRCEYTTPLGYRDEVDAFATALGGDHLADPRARFLAGDGAEREPVGEARRLVDRYDGDAVDLASDLARVDLDERDHLGSLPSKFARERLPDRPGAPDDGAVASE